VRHRFTSMEALASFVRSRPPPSHHVIVEHDDACTPTACTCRPHYVLEDLTVENVLAGAKAEAAWRKQRAS